MIELTIIYLVGVIFWAFFFGEGSIGSDLKIALGWPWYAIKWVGLGILAVFLFLTVLFE